MSYSERLSEYIKRKRKEKSKNGKRNTRNVFLRIIQCILLQQTGSTDEAEVSEDLLMAEAYKRLSGSSSNSGSYTSIPRFYSKVRKA